MKIISKKEDACRRLLNDSGVYHLNIKKYIKRINLFIKDPEKNESLCLCNLCSRKYLCDNSINEEDCIQRKIKILKEYKLM